MQKLQERQKSRVSPKKLLGALVALVAFFILLTSVIGLAEKHASLKGRIKELNAEQENLTEKKATLLEMTDELKTPQGQEQALRNKYNLVRPGEEMIIIMQSDSEIEAQRNERFGVSKWWHGLLEGLGFKKK